METLSPTTEREWLELRAKNINSTECAALFGLSPYTTIFELWHEKKNNEVVKIDENERMLWGKRLQDTIASGIAQDNGWKVRRMDEYMQLPEIRLGASFDFSIEAKPDISVIDRMEYSHEKGLLEIKNVDSLIFKNSWIENDDKSIEAPAHIELQLQHQLLVSGRSYGYIAALVGGNRLILIERKAEPSIHEEIKKRAFEFWRSIEDGIEPQPDFSRDAKALSKLYGVAEPGKLVSVDGDDRAFELAKEYVTIGSRIKKLETRKTEIKAEVMAMIGDAEKAVHPDFSISAGMVGPAHVEYDREGYRSFRITPKKIMKEQIESEVWADGV